MQLLARAHRPAPPKSHAGSRYAPTAIDHGRLHIGTEKEGLKPRRAMWLASLWPGLWAT